MVCFETSGLPIVCLFAWFAPLLSPWHWSFPIGFSLARVAVVRHYHSSHLPIEILSHSLEPYRCNDSSVPRQQSHRRPRTTTTAALVTKSFKTPSGSKPGSLPKTSASSTTAWATKPPPRSASRARAPRPRHCSTLLRRFSDSPQPSWTN